MLLVLVQVLNCSLLGLEYGHKERVWQMSAIHLGIVNEVETAGSQSQLMLLILQAATPGLSPYHSKHIHMYKRDASQTCLVYCSRPKPHVTYHVTQPLTEVVLVRVIAVEVVFLPCECYLF